LRVLQQEATGRGATLVCSLHQVELARAHFPRIVGLRAGRVVFDAPRAAVTDAMIAALYQNANAAAPVPTTIEPDAIAAQALVVPRCF
jgi:phosphonate transport system ATP-binding protein